MRDEIRHCVRHFLAVVFRQLRDHSLRHWLIVIAILGIGTYGGHKLGEWNGWINLRYRLYQSFLGHLSVKNPRPKRSVLVLITDNEFWAPPLSGRSPLKRDYLANLIRKLDTGNPQVIALDVDLSATLPDNKCGEPGPYDVENNQLFEAVRDISKERTVVLARTVAFSDPSTNSYYSVPAISDCAGFDSKKVHTGYITLPPDIRRVPLVLPTKGQNIDSFASAIVRSIDEHSLDEAQRNTHDALPYGTFIQPQQFTQYSARDVLNSDESSLKDSFECRTVIIGGAWHLFGSQRGPENDFHRSPVGSIYGAFIHANYVEALLDSRTYTPMREPVAIGIEVLCSAILALVLSLRFKLRWKLLLASFVSLTLITLSYISWQNLGIFFDFFVPEVLLVAHVVFERIKG